MQNENETPSGHAATVHADERETDRFTHVDGVPSDDPLTPMPTGQQDTDSEQESSEDAARRVKSDPRGEGQPTKGA